MTGIVINPFSVSVPPVTLSFVTANGNIANQTSYTFAAQSVGAAAAQRRVIIGVKSQVVDITSVTYNGVAMTRLTTASAGPTFLSFWEIDEAVLTSTTLVFATSGGTATNIRFAVWNVFGGNLLSLRNQQTASTSTQTVSITLSCPDTSGVLAISAHSDNAGVTGITWTGATERDDASPEATTQRFGAADATISTAQSLGLTSLETSTGSIFSSIILGVCL